MKAHIWRRCALTTLLAISAGTVGAQAAEPRWETIQREAGITVSMAEEPGQKVATFRGEGEVDGSLWHVLAIVMDDGRAKEWAKGADESKVLRRIDGRTQIVYSRSHQTWPVRDRDLVMRRSMEVVTPGEVMRVRLVCVDGEKPELSSVIRVHDCETVFVLHKVSEQRTRVDFRVRADAGGGSPDWIARLASKSIPLETVRGLRKQVEKTKGRYEAAIESLRRAL